MKSHTACVQPNLVLKLYRLLFLEAQMCSEGTCWTGCDSHTHNENGIEEHGMSQSCGIERYYSFRSDQ